MFGIMGEVIWWLTYVGMQIALIYLGGQVILDALSEDED
jgi:hypothetical protein|tara:strand:- start:1229 stop:1345 length:117 start_codon:yes stop_codon:yes gene_type:complete